MAEPILLVQGDTSPQVKVTLTRKDTGSAEDLTGSTVKLHFRKKATTTLLFSITGSQRQMKQLMELRFLRFLVVS